MPSQSCGLYMYGWQLTINKAKYWRMDALNWYIEDSWYPWLQGDQTSQIRWNQILNIHWTTMPKPKIQYFANYGKKSTIERLMLEKISAGGEGQRMRLMASLTTDIFMFCDAGDDRQMPQSTGHKKSQYRAPRIWIEPIAFLSVPDGSGPARQEDFEVHPWVRRSRRRKWQLTIIFLPENSMRWLGSYSLWVTKFVDTNCYQYIHIIIIYNTYIYIFFQIPSPILG